jgi:hypothetical protein
MFKRIRSYRLFDRGGPGLACDGEGVSLGGVELATLSDDLDARRCLIRSTEEIRDILGLAYGPQPEQAVQRCERGLLRVATWLEAGELAHAQIEAVLLRFPEIDPDRLAKLSAVAPLEKGGSSWQDQPRVPAGQSGGGQWTTGDAGTATPPGQSKPPRRGDANDITIGARVRQSRTQNASGFYPNSAGGGVLYIPSVSDGRPIRSTEVHVLDANAFQVSWADGTISLKGRAGHLYAVSANDLDHFNATTGQILGVSIYAFPDETLAGPDDPPTPSEQAQLEQERANFEAGRQASEQSWSGRVTTGAVLLDTGLPVLSLLPMAADGVPTAALNTPEENLAPTGVKLARRLGLEGERAVGITTPKVGIKIPGTSQLRVPDALDETAKILTEVKNVARLRLSPQLRDFLTYCRVNGYRFVLYVRRRTDLSEELWAAIRRGEIKLKHIPRSR